MRILSTDLPLIQMIFVEEFHSKSVESENITSSVHTG